MVGSWVPPFAVARLDISVWECVAILGDVWCSYGVVGGEYRFKVGIVLVFV